jgi:DNA-binding GntR family transcriptional regulator
MRFVKIPVKTLRQRVYEQLRATIIHAGVLPGGTLSLRGLAREFGVSLMPVREALWQLESERVVVIETNRRIHVNTLSVPEMQQVRRIRLVLESMAAKLSCEYRPDSALPKVKALLDQTGAYLQKSPRKYVKANFDFHRSIYSYCGSDVLMRHIDLLWARVGPYFYYVQLQTDVDFSGWQKHHEAMYAAWASRDKKKMVEALKGDLSLPIRFEKRQDGQGASVLGNARQRSKDNTASA